MARAFDFDLNPEQIPEFLERAFLALRSRRVKTSFSAEESVHCIHSGLLQGDYQTPVICVIKVRKRTTKKGKTLIWASLDEVRQPVGDDIAEGGYDKIAAWSSESEEAAWRTFSTELKRLEVELKERRTIEEFRGFTSCYSSFTEKGIIYGTGVWQKGEIRQSPALRQAYATGKSV